MNLRILFASIRGSAVRGGPTKTGGCSDAWPLLALVLGWGMYAGRFWLHAPRPIGASDDLVLYLAAALRLNEPTLFARDQGYQAMAQALEPLVYTRILACLLRYVASPEWLAVVLSSFLLLLFSLGVYFLVKALTDSPGAALSVAFISLRPRMGLLAEWGIVMGEPLARSFILAASPWILLSIWRLRRDPHRLILPGIIIGLSGLLHPLSALHLALLTLAQEALMSEGARSLLFLGGGALVGALPAIWNQVGLIAGAPAPLWFLRFRNPELLPSGARAIVGFLAYDLGVPLILAGLTWKAARKHLPSVTYSWVRAGIVAAILLSVASLLASYFPFLARLSLGRISGYAYLFLSIVILTSAWEWWRGQPRRRFAAGMVAASLALSTGAYWDVFLDRSFSLAGAPIGPRASWYPSRPPESVPSIPAFRPELDPSAFRELCGWINSSTSPEAVFLTPPADPAAIRVYAKRGIVISWKDAGLMIHSAVSANAWYARYREVVSAYADHDPQALVAAGRRLGATHILMGRPAPPLPLEQLFANRAFVVYRL